MRLFMENKKIDKGFSLLEICIVIAMIAIVVAIAAPSLSAYYRIYKFKEYAYSIESLVKASKLTAMERSVNVGVCVDSAAKTISIVNMKDSRSKSQICSDTVLNTLRIEDSFVSLSGSAVAFDPRGFAIFIGNVCVSNDAKYYKVIISRFGAIRIDKGSGGCS